MTSPQALSVLFFKFLTSLFSSSNNAQKNLHKFSPLCMELTKLLFQAK